MLTWGDKRQYLHLYYFLLLFFAVQPINDNPEFLQLDVKCRVIKFIY